MSASLIGRLGSSARLPSTAVSMSLTGSRFSSESAPRPLYGALPGQVGEVLDKLLDAGLELHLPHHSDLEAEVTQSTAQVVLDGDRLRLQQLAMVSSIRSF